MFPNGFRTSQSGLKEPDSTTLRTCSNTATRIKWLFMLRVSQQHLIKHGIGGKRRTTLRHEADKSAQLPHFYLARGSNAKIQNCWNQTPARLKSEKVVLVPPSASSVCADVGGSCWSCTEPTQVKTAHTRHVIGLAVLPHLAGLENLFLLPYLQLYK